MNIHHQINLIQAFSSMQCFLSFYYFNYYSDDLGSIFKNIENWENNPQTCDPSAWNDWVKSTQETLSFPVDKSTDFNKLLITEDQAFNIMIHFINHYKTSMHSSELESICSTLQNTSQKLTCLQAYRAMLRCFDNIYFQTYDDDVCFLVSNAALYSASDDQFIQPQTMNPAIWHEWMDNVKIVLNDPLITWNRVELTQEQAYQAAGQYFAIHVDIGLFENIRILRDLLKNDVNHPELSQWLRCKREQALVKILQEPLPEKIGHFLGKTTELSLRESFLVMQYYLNNICRKDPNPNLIDLLQRSRIQNYHTNYWQDEPTISDPDIWKFWVQATKMVSEQTPHKKLALITTFKTLPLFLLGYFNENQTPSLHSLVMKFEVNKNDEPMHFDNWLAFNNAAVEVNTQQIEIVYNLVSINTPIDPEKAKNIILAWFKMYSLNIDWVKYFEPACKIIKHQNRSYLLLDGEITILETYQIMLHIISTIHQKQKSKNLNAFLQQNAIDADSKPVDFIQLLKWIQCAELV